MHISLPLLLGIFRSNSRMFASVLIFLNRHEVHIPHTNYKVPELNISFKMCAYELMVLCEVMQRDRSLVFELIIRTVQCSKEVQKLKTGLFNCFEISYNFRVS
jgi:hypothetical protein